MLNHDRFRAYSALVRLRNGGRVEHPSDTEHELDEYGGTSNHEDIRSDADHAISPFDSTVLMELF